MQESNHLRQQLQNYVIQQREWLQQRENLLKRANFLQQDVNKLKAMNSTLMNKAKHKRTSSEEHTFIFNQTNISSIYPMVLFQSNNWSCKTHIRGHLDAVRAVWWVGDNLVSGSDDGIVKVWDNDQCKAIVREHLGPIYSICGNNQQVFMAGAEGVVRKWDNEDLFTGKGPSDEVEFNLDCIWELSMNPNKSILLASSADGTCKLIHLDQKMIEGKSFTIKNDIPTSIDWIGTNQFLCGYVNSCKLALYDIQLGVQAKQYTFSPKEKNSQVNKLIFSERHKLIISAHEDRCLRFFDPNSNRLIKAITGHSDAVTSVCTRNQGYQILSCGHDGSIRIWDLRKYRCVHDISVHMRKYDEAAICLSHKRDQPIVAIGGADGHIKLLTPQH